MDADSQREIIKKTKENGGQYLELSYKGITELSEEIGDLVDLKILNISNNPLKGLPHSFVNLKKLEQLDISKIQINTLPNELIECTNLKHLDCYGNKELKNLDVIGNLKQLEKINAYDIPIQSFPEEMQNCKLLRSLDFASTNIKSIPDWISKLNVLDTLHLANCCLEDISEELFSLKDSLEKLYLFKNKIRILSAKIGNLTKLTYLDVEGNKITELPKEIQNLPNLTYLNVKENPFMPQILPEVLKRPEEVGPILKYFSRIWNEETKPLNEGKIVVVGNENVGKSNIVKGLLKEEFKLERIVTPNIEVKTYNLKINPSVIHLGEQNVKLNIWDFGGQEIMHSAHEYFLSERSLYLIVLDLSKGDSISEICVNNDLKYWLTKVKDKIKDSPIIIVGNKFDLCRDKVFNNQIDELLYNLKIKYPTLQIKAFLTVSCSEKKLGDSFASLEDRIQEETRMIEEIFYPFPLSWENVKRELEKMKEKKLTSISLEEYEKICERENVTKDEDRKFLLRILYRIGTILYFEGNTFYSIQSQVLEPEWVINGIYAIINSDRLKNKNDVV